MELSMGNVMNGGGRLKSYICVSALFVQIAQFESPAYRMGPYVMAL